jgi:creatinine amidohydrolase
MDAGPDAGGRILDLVDMTAFEADRLDRARTTVFLVISPVEEHGPHLPLGTDIYEAEAVARRLAARIVAARPSETVVFYPPIPVGADGFRFVGTAEVRPAVVAALVEDVCASLAEGGFARFIVSSHHGGPRHNLALERAARRVPARTGGRARLLSLAGRTIVGLYFEGGLESHHERMGDDDGKRRALAVDCHAGAFETSELLAIRPDLVRPGWAELPPVLLALEKLTPGAGRSCADGKGYFGAPALSSRERGEAYMDMVVERALPDVLAFLDGKDVPGLAWRWRAGLAFMAAWASARDAFAAWTGRR